MKNNSKKLIFTFLLLTIGISYFQSCKKPVLEEVTPTETTEEATPEILSQRPISRPVRAEVKGLSLKRKCLVGYGNCKWAIYAPRTQAGALPVQLTLIGRTTLRVVYKPFYRNEDGRFVKLDKNQMLPSFISRQLIGRTGSITMLAGTYPTRFARGNFYTDIRIIRP